MIAPNTLTNQIQANTELEIQQMTYKKAVYEEGKSMSLNLLK